MLKNHIAALCVLLGLCHTPIGAQPFQEPGKVLTHFQNNYNYFAQLRPYAKDSIERAAIQMKAPSDTIAMGYYMLANDQILKSNGAAADGYLKRGFATAATNQMRAPLYQLDEQLATNLLHDYTRSLYSNQKSVECYEEYGDYGNAAYSKINLAYAYSRFGLCDKAQAQIPIALNYFEQNRHKLPAAYIPGFESNLTSFAQFVSGQVAICKGERAYLSGSADSARVYYAKGLAVFRAFEQVGDPWKAGIIHLAIGKAKLALEYPADSIAPHLNKAAAAFKSNQQVWEHAVVQIAQGYLSAKNGRLADTTLLLDGLSLLMGQPIGSLFQDIDPKYFERSNGLNLYYLKEAFLYKARLSDALFENTGRTVFLALKDKDLNNVLEIGQAQKLMATDEESLYTIDEQFAGVYRMAASNAFKRWENQQESKFLDDCWRYIQQSKEATMQSRVNLRTAALEPGAWGQLAQLDNQQRDDIRKKYLAFLLSNPQTPISKYNEHVWLSAKNAYSDWLQQLAKGDETAQNFYAQRYKEKILTHKAIAQSLPSDLSVIEYFYLNDRELLVFVLSAAKNVVQKITLPPTAHAGLVDWATQLRKPHYDYERFFKAALSAYQNYLEPIATDVKTERVVVCADRVLAAIPFEAMIWAAPADYTTYNVDRYLIYKHAFSYNYSASFFLKGFLAPPTNSEYALDWLGMAPYMKDIEGGSTECPESRHWQKPEFVSPESGLSVETIGAYLQRENAAFRLKPLFGEDASLPMFMEWAHKTRYLYLNTHGILSTPHSNEPHILFYPTCHEGGTRHFGLSTSQIYAMNVPAELAFINTCNSYAGDWHEGIGLLSISRAFTFAGAKTVISNRWDAQGDHAAAMGLAFFENAMSLPKEITLDMVLHVTKQKSIELFPPQVWANPVLVGNLKR